MPFGLDIKSIIVGIILALFVLPHVTAMFNRTPTAKAAA